MKPGKTNPDCCAACGLPSAGFMLCADCGIDMIIKYGSGTQVDIAKYIKDKEHLSRMTGNPDAPLS